MNILARFFAFPFNLNQRRCASALLISAAALWVSHPARAVNLLVNPSFELNSGHAVAKGWTRFAPPTAQLFGNYWVENTNSVVVAQQGSLYWKEWGACYNGTNNAAGLYQDFGCVPGNTYQASGWFYVNPGDAMGADCYTWLEVLFLARAATCWRFTNPTISTLAQARAVGSNFRSTMAAIPLRLFPLAIRISTLIRSPAG